jgi:hypothetical protein
MAEITIKIPDAHYPAVLAVLAEEAGWTNEPGGPTKVQNARAQIRRLLRQKVKRYRMNQEHDAGVATVVAELEDWTDNPSGG